MKEKITALLFMGLIFGLLGGLFLYEDNAPITEFLTEYRSTILAGTPIFERIVGAIDIAETVVYDDSWKRKEFVDFHGLIQKAMGKKVMTDAGYGEIYKTKYDQIIFTVNEKEEAVCEAAKELISLDKKLKEAGIPLLYVQAPFKLPQGDQQLPAHAKDYSNINADRFLEKIKAADVDYLDLRPLLASMGKSQNELFFDTDHHWKIETAFDATVIIENELNKNYGFNIEEKYMDINNYEKVIYKNSFLGSMGRRTGKLYSGVDDFTLITPKFKTAYTLREYDYGAWKKFEGSFQEAVLIMDNITNPDIETNKYAVYHGDNTELVFNNNLVNDGNVLMIKDSFGLPVYSFMSLGINTLRALDLRLYEESISEYAKVNLPDVVIVMYNADSFNKSIFDFEGKI